MGSKSEKYQEVEPSLSVLVLTDICLTFQWKPPTADSTITLSSLF